MQKIEIQQTTGFNAVVSIAGSEFEITVSDPFAEQDEKRLEWYFEQWIRFPFSDGTIAKRAADSIRAYGENLFEQVFGDREAYAAFKSLKVSELEIIIRGEPEFQGLHWEAMRDPKAARPLAIDCVMVRQRRVKGRASTRQIEPSTVLNLLIVTARPNEENDVGYRTISRPMVEAIRDGQLPVNVEIVRPGTYKAFLDHLEAKPEGFYHVVHFDLHGGLMAYERFQKYVPTGENYLFGRGERLEELPQYAGMKAFLLFEGNEAGQATPVAADEIAGQLQDRGIPVCILNACQSGKQIGANDETAPTNERETSLGARLMDAGIQMVVAMGYSVTVDAAKALMQQVYRELFAGKTLPQALRLGRRELFDRKKRRVYFNQEVDLEDWLLPVVYGNQEIDFRLREMTFAETDEYYTRQTTEYRFGGTTYGFVGRDLDILKLEKALLRHGVVLVQGMGGTGKTTLLRYLREWWVQTNFVDRVFYFGYDTKAWTLEQMCFAIAEQIFSDLERRQFQAMRSEAQVGRLVQEFRSRRFGLMLDNLESVTGQALAIQNTLPPEEQERIRDFLDRIAGGRSIVVLGSRGREEWLKSAYQENRYELRGLDQEARSQLAKQVLERHVSERKKREAILADREFERLMRILAGYPLAIEVVLANLKHQSVAQVLAGLDAADVGVDRTGGRTESILKCVEYSHSNLSEEAQKLLLCLAPFSGFLLRGALPQYVEHLRQFATFHDYPFEQFDEAIQEAIDWGLLSPIDNIDKDSQALTVQPVFPYFLKTKLDQVDAVIHEAIFEGFKTHYRELAYGYEQLMDSKEPQDRYLGIIGCQCEYENLYNALKICLEKHESISIFSCLHKYLSLISDIQNSLKLAEVVCGSLENYSPELSTSEIGSEMVNAYLKLGNSYLRAKDYPSARLAYLKMLELLQSLEALPIQQRQLASGSAYYQLGMVAEELRELEQARDLYRQALQLAIAFNNRYAQAGTYHHLGIVAQELHELEEAQRCHLQSLQLKIEINDRYAQASTWHQLGRVSDEFCDFEEARRRYQQALQIFIEYNDRYSQANTYSNLGIVAYQLRDFEEAHRCYRQALQIQVEFNDRYSQARTYALLGLLAEAEGNVSEARACLQTAMEIFTKFGDEHSMAMTQQHLDRLSD